MINNMDPLANVPIATELDAEGIIMGKIHIPTWIFPGDLKISRTWKNPGPLEIFRSPWKIPGLLEIFRGYLISRWTSSEIGQKKIVLVMTHLKNIGLGGSRWLTIQFFCKLVIVRIGVAMPALREWPAPPVLRNYKALNAIEKPK